MNFSINGAQKGAKLQIKIKNFANCKRGNFAMKKGIAVEIKKKIRKGIYPSNILMENCRTVHQICGNLISQHTTAHTLPQYQNIGILQLSVCDCSFNQETLSIPQIFPIFTVFYYTKERMWFPTLNTPSILSLHEVYIFSIQGRKKGVRINGESETDSWNKGNIFLAKICFQFSIFQF